MLSAHDISLWRTRGWVTASMDVTSAAAEARDLLPDTDEATEFGSPGAQGEFPTGRPALDDICARPELVHAVRGLLGAREVRLLQSDVWAKKGGIDQRVHQDYGNNTLLLPRWESPEAVAVIIYYDDWCGGATRVVSRRGADDPAYAQGPARIAPGYHLPFVNDRADAEALVLRRAPALAAFRATLYDREEAVPYARGTVLFYRHDLWHRGTPTDGRTRRVHSLGYVRAGAPGWTTWNRGFARNMYYGHVEDLVRRWTPAQRVLLGIPEARTSDVVRRYVTPLARL